MAEINFENAGKIFGVSNDYINLVKEAFNSREEGFCIENSSILHAKFLSYLLIKRAKKNINILTNTLNNDLYKDNQIIDAIKEKLDEGIKIKVKMKMITPKNYPFFKLRETHPNLEIFQLIGNNIKNNFLISDDNAFRIEERSYNRNEVHAIANFNSPELVQNLEDSFTTFTSLKPLH